MVRTGRWVSSGQEEGTVSGTQAEGWIKGFFAAHGDMANIFFSNLFNTKLRLCARRHAATISVRLSGPRSQPTAGI